MGAFLDKPRTEKIMANGEANGLRYGVSAMQGWRMEMEDAHICKTDFFLKDHSFFGVFDGHAGSAAAKFCSENILDSIKTCLGEDATPTPENLSPAIKEGFLVLDDHLSKQSKFLTNEDHSGTTAIAVMITPEKIIWSNCGDSRALICRNGELLFATHDHKPYNDDERKRIERAGGSVMMQRVNGSLAVSRALGDFTFKKTPNFAPNEQLVSPEPEMTTLDRNLEGDEFILLACDGIFDVMTNEAVVTFVQHELKLYQNLSQICSDLIDTCLHKNSRDNMSVILITFKAAPQASEENIEAEKSFQSKVYMAIEDSLKGIVENATDPMDLEERHVMEQLSLSLPEEYNVYGKIHFVNEQLKEMKEKKFGPEAEIDYDFDTDPSQVPEAFRFTSGSNNYFVSQDDGQPSLDSDSKDENEGSPRPLDSLPSPVKTDSAQHSSIN